MDKAVLDLNLVKTFLKAAQDFCGKCDLNSESLSYQVAVQEGVQWRNITDYLNENTSFKGNLAVQATFNFGTYKLILHYSTEQQYLMGMGFAFSNAELQTVYGFEELNNVLAPDDFRRYFSEQLINAERLLIAFDWLTNLFSNIKSDIELASVDMEILKKLADNRLHDQAIFEKRLSPGGITLIKTPAIDIAYQMLRKNEYSKALNALKTIKGDLTVFESRLADFLADKESETNPTNFEVIPSEIDSYIQDGKQSRWDNIEALFIFASLPFAFALGILPLLGFYCLYDILVGGLYIVKPDIWLCVVFGVFTSGFLINPIKKIWLRIFLKERYNYFRQHKTAHPDILGKRILFVLGTVVTIGAIVFYTLFLCNNVIFCEDGMIDNTKLFSLSGEFIYYEDIECVYRVNAFMNAYDEVYERAALAIKLNDGRIINLRPIGMPDEESLTFLREKVPMAAVEFIEDIE